MTALILRKLLASSREAIAAPLDTLKERLGRPAGPAWPRAKLEFAEKLIEGEENGGRPTR